MITELTNKLNEMTADLNASMAREQRWRQAVAMLLRHEPEEKVRSLLDGIVYDLPDEWCRKSELDAEIARLKALIVDVTEKNMVLEARLAGNSQEMAEALGREVRDSLLKNGTVP